MLSRASAGLMSRPALTVTTAVLGVEAAALVFADRWAAIVWLALSCLAAVAAPVLNAGPLAPLLGRVLLMLAAAVMAGPAVVAVRDTLAA
jgi:hypothetical protein